MNKQDAERITTEYLKPVYGFALKRCRSLQDAEDLGAVAKYRPKKRSRGDKKDVASAYFLW